MSSEFPFFSATCSNVAPESNLNATSMRFLAFRLTPMLRLKLTGIVRLHPSAFVDNTARCWRFFDCLPGDLKRWPLQLQRTPTGLSVKAEVIGDVLHCHPIPQSESQSDAAAHLSPLRPRCILGPSIWAAIRNGAARPPGDTCICRCRYSRRRHKLELSFIRLRSRRSRCTLPHRQG
jgi:hypothetical protein